MNDNYKRASRQAKDVQGEHVVGEYLDRYFYPLFTTSTERCYDKKKQVQGIDITVNTSGVSYTIDEKAAVCYANKDLRTFSQEITSRYTGDDNPNKGELYNGWAVSNTLNDYYVFVWIPECKTTGEVLSMDSIITLDVALVKKSDMYNWYHSRGLTASALLAKSKEIRNAVGMGLDWWQYCTDCTNYSLNGKGYKYHINTQTEENSVNILVSKDIICKKLATYSVRFKDGKIIDTYRKQI